MSSSQTDSEGNALAKNSVGTAGLVFQAMGQLSPIGIFGGSILGAASFAEGATPLAFIIGMFAALLSANTIFQYSKKVASARGYYGYVGNGLGRYAGAMTSYLYVLYQVANISFIFAYYVLTFSPTFSYVFGTNVSNDYGYLYIILISIPAFYLVYRGIKPSYKSQMIVNSIQIAFVVLISLVVIATAKDNTLATFTPIASVGWKGVFLGFITGSYLAYAGYGSIVPLGEEAKTPRRSIGVSTVLLVIIMSALYLLGSYAMVVGWGVNSMSSFSSNIYPGFVVVSQHIGSSANVLFFLLNFFVVFPLYVTMVTAVSRNIYSMSRDGYFPKYFYSVHERYKSPHRAIGLTAVLFFIVALVMSVIFFYTQGGFFNGFFYEFLFFATASTVSTLIIHLLVNTSLSVSGDKESKSPLKYITHYALPTSSTVVTLIAIYYAVYSLTPPLNYSPILVLVFALLVLAGAILRRNKLGKVDYSSKSETPEA